MLTCGMVEDLFIVGQGRVNGYFLPFLFFDFPNDYGAFMELLKPNVVYMACFAFIVPF